MSDTPIPPRPQTPQVLLHRLPDKPPDAPGTARKPAKYLVLLMGSTAVAGKVQIAGSLADALSCPVYHGDSLHESSAKAASVGASRAPAAAAAAAPGAGAGAGAGAGGGDTDTDGGPREPGARAAVAARAAAPGAAPGPAEARYRRMWLAKLTRTGLLFPGESRPATGGFSGFGGTAPPPASRGVPAGSSVAPAPSNRSEHGRPVVYPALGDGLDAAFALSEAERLRRTSPVLMVLTHPELESWHKVAIREAVGEYGIGVIFVPLYEEDEESDEENLPILRPLDPTKLTSFPVSCGTFDRGREQGSLDTEMKLSVDVSADVESRTVEIIEGVRGVLGVQE